MHNRVHSFYKSERIICLIMLILGIVFGILYFLADSVTIQYTYFFYTMSGFGLIFIFHYGRRLLFYRKWVKGVSSDGSIPNDLPWVEPKIQEVERYRIILQVIFGIGVLMILVGFAGYMKQLVAGTGLAVVFGTGIWFAAELFNELHLKEYKQFLEK